MLVFFFLLQLIQNQKHCLTFDDLSFSLVFLSLYIYIYIWYYSQISTNKSFLLFFTIISILINLFYLSRKLRKYFFLFAKNKFFFILFHSLSLTFQYYFFAFVNINIQLPSHFLLLAKQAFQTIQDACLNVTNKFSFV